MKSLEEYTKLVNESKVQGNQTETLYHFFKLKVLLNHTITDL